jgi:N-methylhydantoinase A
MLSPQTAIDFGMVVRSPMIEITTIGAGGGSIAWVDKGGLLMIGPESAGSTPGPVAYGQGNTRPTVTDANVVLGRIDPENPIGGKLERLDVAAAEAAILEHVGKPLGLDALAAAEAILRVANSRMAGALRLVSIERGFDPARFAFMPFGGGGALHAGAMLAEVGLARAIVPRYPGVTSAMGCVIADMRQDFVQTVNAMLAGIDTASLAAHMQAHVDSGLATLEAARTSFEARETSFTLDMAYLGQTHTVSVPLPVTVQEGRVTPPSEAEIAEAFDAAYRETYGRLLKNGTRRIINLRTAVTGKRPRFDLSTLAPEGGSTEAALKGRRRVHFGEAWHETRIYDRLALPVGAEVRGPAILEQPDTTVLIEPELVGRIDSFGNTIIERAAE